MRKVTQKNSQRENADGFATKQDIRNLGALIEDTNHSVKLIAEQYGDIKGDISSMKGEIHSMKGDIYSMKGEIHSIKETLSSHTEMIGKLAVDMTSVKTDLKSVKESLTEKVNRKEFVALDKRVLHLEHKVIN